MRSSTFSFDRAPHSPTWWQLVVIGAVFILVVGVTEIVLRSAGGRPSATLSVDRWAASLHATLQSPHPFTTVLLGASQIRTGFSSTTFSKRYPKTPLFFLATAGESPYATVHYLANRTDFAGCVVVSLQEGFLETHRLQEQRYLIDFYDRDWRTDKRIDFYIDDIYGNLVFRQPRFALRHVLDSVIRGNGLPEARYWRHNHRNGESDYFFNHADQRRLHERRWQFDKDYAVADIDEWSANFARLDAAVETIIERGGQVALVKWPLDASWSTRNSQRFPTEIFWDTVVVQSHAIVLDTSRIPDIKSLPQHDGNHIDANDKARFTQILLDALEARGMQFAVAP